MGSTLATVPLGRKTAKTVQGEAREGGGSGEERRTRLTGRLDDTFHGDGGRQNRNDHASGRCRDSRAGRWSGEGQDLSRDLKLDLECGSR